MTSYTQVLRDEVEIARAIHEAAGLPPLAFLVLAAKIAEHGNEECCLECLRYTLHRADVRKRAGLSRSEDAEAQYARIQAALTVKRVKKAAKQKHA